jgi:hypothetical protein
MKRKIIIATGLILLTSINIAYADGCPSGVCAVEINCTTGVVTYTDAPPRPDLPLPILFETASPINTLIVQTANTSWGTSGTPEQIAQAVQKLAPAPLVADPCINGGCTKVEVNATTGVTTILPLSEADLKQRAKNQVEQNQRQAELAKSAYQALPNITAWQPYNLFNKEPLPATIQDKTLIPEWWSDWQQSFNLFFQNWFWWWAL